jgi:preprotein translocase subunit SecF
MELFKQPNIDFLKYKIPAMLFSLVIIIAGVFVIWQKGLRYGVDFSGGTAIHVKFRKPVPLDAIRSALKDAGFRDSGVQGFKDPTQVLVRLPQTAASEEQIEALSVKVSQILTTTVLKQSPPPGRKDLNLATPQEIAGYLQLQDPLGVHDPARYAPEAARLQQLENANGGLLPPFEQMQGKVDSKIISALQNQYFISDMSILSNEYVGPQVGAELRTQAKLAIAWSLAGLLVYVWFRFEFLWGLSGVLCLAHDVMITLAFFAFFQREISLTVVAAFLTIVGFSLNDTIVIYDRVRDNLKTMKSQPLANVINLTINQMINRTLLTNGTVFIVTIVLYLFGGEVINDFAFAMLIGSVSGTYSTIYIASALIVLYQDRFGKKRKVVPVKARVGSKVS